MGFGLRVYLRIDKFVYVHLVQFECVCVATYDDAIRTSCSCVSTLLVRAGVTECIRLTVYSTASPLSFLKH